MVRYISLAEAISFHDDIVARTGQAPSGLRDEGLLESALLRGQAATYYQGADLLSQAALIGIGISRNQPFVDGNKRAAYAVLDVFFRLNGVLINGSPLDIAKQLERASIPGRDPDEALAEFVTWLREHSEPR